MIDRCFNPACGKELRYLRDGRVVRVIQREGDKTLVKHYWLCGACYEQYDFEFPTGGEVTLRARPGRHSDKFDVQDVLLS
jgi:hypothetical protein